MIDFNKAVFIVDGKTEMVSFNKRIQNDFPNTKPEFRKIACNGRDVTEEGYANKASGILIEALNSRFLHIICVFDRESRRKCAERICIDLRNAIITTIIQKTHFKKKELERKIIVSVPDIMFENWIIADIEGIKSTNLINNESEQQYFDGTSGLSQLKQFMNVPYKKVAHAPVLFNAISFERAKNNSASFADFLSKTQLCGAID